MAAAWRGEKALSSGVTECAGGKERLSRGIFAARDGVMGHFGIV